MIINQEVLQLLQHIVAQNQRMSGQLLDLTAQIQQLSGQVSDLTDRVSDLEERKANNNCSQSTMQQAIPRKLQSSSSLVSPFASTRNPYANTKTEVTEVNVLKRGRAEKDSSEEGKDSKLGKMSNFEMICYEIGTAPAVNHLVVKLLKKKYGEVYPNDDATIWKKWNFVQPIYSLVLAVDSSWVCYQCAMKHNKNNELKGHCSQYNQLQEEDAVACIECLLLDCNGGTNCPGHRAKVIASICASEGPVREIVKRNLDEALEQEKLDFPDAICLGQPKDEHIKAMYEFFQTLVQNATYNKLFWDAVDKTGIFTSEFLSKSKDEVWKRLNFAMKNGEPSIRL